MKRHPGKTYLTSFKISTWYFSEAVHELFGEDDLVPPIEKKTKGSEKETFHYIAKLIPGGTNTDTGKNKKDVLSQFLFCLFGTSRLFLVIAIFEMFYYLITIFNILCSCRDSGPRV